MSNPNLTATENIDLNNEPETQPAPQPGEAAPGSDGCLVLALRFCGGLVLGFNLPLILAEWLHDERWASPLVENSGMLAILCALGSAGFLAFGLSEANIERKPRPSAAGIMLGTWALVLRFLGGWLLFAFGAMFLWPYLVPFDDPNYEKYLSLPYWGSMIGGLLAVALPLGRKRLF